MAYTVKSTPIANLDATPVVRSTTGEGASGYVKMADGFLTAAANQAVGNTLAFCRLPTTAKVKSVWVESVAQTAGAMNLGLYYSDSTVDGTPPSLQGTAADATLFCSALSVASAVAADETNQSTNYPMSKRQEPLWQAAGLTADPGGFFDVVGVVTTAFTTGGLVGVRVEYVE